MTGTDDVFTASYNQDVKADQQGVEVGGRNRPPSVDGDYSTAGFGPFLPVPTTSESTVLAA